jgi:Ser/Thr protein kinase RdoA (MazF antagonist)
MIAQTTPTGEAVAQAVAADFAVGPIRHCVLLRRGFNHVYGIELGDGGRRIARISAERPRGLPNTEYEAAGVAHVQRSGVPVAASIATRDGAAAAFMALPEGPRALMLFEHLDGDPPEESLPDVEATGRGLAQLHEAGQGYTGPASRYVLELPHLLERSLQVLGTAPTMTDALRAEFARIAQRLAGRIEAMPSLARVACHGDCHGSNNFMTGPEGARVASFFDFDDAGPGFLAYELSVYLWGMLPRKVGGELSAEALERWRRYIAGYRAVRPLADGDFAAISAFVPVRQFWLMGEYAGRVSVWGTQSIPTYWLSKQVDLLTAWEQMKTPE